MILRGKLFHVSAVVVLTLPSDPRRCSIAKGPGRATAFSALRALPEVARQLGGPLPDVDRLLCAGHSMGGHGAWLLAIAARDAAIGMVSSASWLREDQYADSNKVLLHDVAAPHVDPALADHPTGTPK